METDDTLPDHLKGVFYAPICSKEEIDRILTCDIAKDYLLKIRADTAVDHMRILRRYRRRKIALGESYTLESCFTQTHYSRFIDNISKENREKISEVTYGDIHSSDANGMIFQSEYGPIVTISESLPLFLKFIHLALLEFPDDVPDYVRLNAARIAIRVMFGNESLDFDVDPRGIVPPAVGKEMHRTIPDQMTFIAGHEFAHFILGHLSEQKFVIAPIFNAFNRDSNAYMPSRVYSASEADEFEADKAAIQLLKYAPRRQREVHFAAVLWFYALEIFENISNQVFPPSAYKMRTHPKAEERRLHLLKHFNLDRKENKWLEQLNSRKEWLIQTLSEDVSLNFEAYEFYGSIYLDKPDSQWRGRELIDREDYY